MLGAIAVKHMAMAANSNPPKNAIKGNKKNSGLVTKPKSAITANTIVVLTISTCVKTGSLILSQNGYPATP